MNQNTREWLEYRLQGIGASDAPIIMGKSEHKTKLQLFDEKYNKIINEDDGKNFVAEKGHRLEAWARPGLEFLTGQPWKPALVEHEQFSFIRASLDGWQPDLNEGWECKYTGREIFDQVSNEELSIRERIPEKWIDQIMQQFFCTGAQAIRLTVIIEEKEKGEDGKLLKDENGKYCGETERFQYTLRIPWDEEFSNYTNKVLMPELFRFWDCVQRGERPEPQDDDVVSIQDKELCSLVETYGKMLEQEKSLKQEADKEIKRILGGIPDQVKELKLKIENHKSRKHKKMEFSGFKITEVSGKEIVDYETAFNSFVHWINGLKQLSPGEIFNGVKDFPDEPNLEKYTKIGKPSLRITAPKNEIKKEEPKKEDDKKHSIVPDSLKEEKEAVRTTQMNPKNHKDRVQEWGNLNHTQQTIVATENGFKNPITGKKPRGWDTKSREERIDYLRTHGKKASGDHSFAMLDLADKLSNLHSFA